MIDRGLMQGQLRGSGPQIKLITVTVAGRWGPSHFPDTIGRMAPFAPAEGGWPRPLPVRITCCKILQNRELRATGG